jgi:hypothetical protein
VGAGVAAASDELVAGIGGVTGAADVSWLVVVGLPAALGGVDSTGTGASWALAHTAAHALITQKAIETTARRVFK